MRFCTIIKNAQKIFNKERNKLIIEEHKKGINEEEIAKIFNIHHSTVHNVIKNFEKSK